MHYSGYRLTVSVAYVTTLTMRQPMTNGLVLLAVSSSKTKPCQFISVQFSSIQLRRSVRALTVISSSTNQSINRVYLGPYSITPTFTENSPQGKSWTQMNVTVNVTNGDKS